MFKKEKIYYLAIHWLGLLSLVVDPVFATGEIPDGFAWTQSPSQAFYFVTDAEIDDYTLVEGEDWIGAFYGDACIGSRTWNGSPTDIPVMGLHEDYPATQNYIIPGEVPRFVIYDASEDSYYDAQVDYDPLEGDLAFTGGMLEIHSIDKLRVEMDCDGNLGAPDGDPYLDDCSVCSEGDSGHQFNSDIDCNGDCFGTAYEDNCGTCDAYENNDCFTYSIELSANYHTKIQTYNMHQHLQK